MRSIGITSYCTPSGYEFHELPKPKLTRETDIIIKVQAASINPIDVKRANGTLKRALADSFPYQIGYDCAGTVTKIGSKVTRCKVGDAVYIKLPESCRGSWSEYVTCPEGHVALKPPSLSFADASSIPLAALTGLQALRKYKGDFSDKTVFVPAGLSGTGSYACQLAKNVFKAGKVITTVSTSKVASVGELLGDSTVDEIIDYKKSDPKAVIPAHSVDFLFDTVGCSMEYLPLLRPGGCIISISTLPPGNSLQCSDLMHLPHKPVIPVYVRVALNLQDYFTTRRARCKNVHYEYIFTEQSGQDLDMLKRWVEEGKLKPVVGKIVKFSDIEAVRQASQVVFDGHGGIELACFVLDISYPVFAAMAPHKAGGNKKRRREPVNVDTKLVEIYEDLANEKDEIRLKAAQVLVSQFTPDKNPTDEQVQKVLTRLFRGLCSSRKAARIGFSIALTEVLSQVLSEPRESSEIDIPRVVRFWEAQTNATQGESGQEQRDHHFGRLFGAEAIIKSSILFKPKAPFSEWTKLLDLVFDLAKKKPWIREECGWIIYRCVYELSAQKAEAKYVETALEHLCSNELARTPEGVAIWLAAKDLFPKVQFQTKVWKHDDPLDAKERNQLAKVMKESSVSDAEGGNQASNAKSSGVWNSKLHFAWDAVLSRFGESSAKESKSKTSRLSFVDFWTEVVDNGLFAASSSEERKYWGFLLLIKVLNESPLPLASHVFTKNLVRCLINQLAVEDRYLHRMAAKAAKTIQTRVSKEPEFAAASINGLMGSAGSVNFDQVTKTKTIEKIVVEADLDSLKQIVSFFERLIARPGTDDSKAAASSRQFLAGLLLSIVRARASASDESGEGADALLEHILFTFVRFAYFMEKDGGSSGQAATEPALTQLTQELFRNRINSCLNSLIANQKHATDLPYAVVRKIRDAAKSEEYGQFIIAMDDTLLGSVKSAFKSLKKLSSTEKKGDTAGVDAFRLLYSMTILQVYNGDADAVSMLEELDFCFSKIFADKKSKKEETTGASDALVEILLSFASKPSQLFRRMSEQVFGAFADQISENGLDSLVSILEAKESLAGQQEMFEQQEDEEGDEEMMDVDEDDSDVEVIDTEGSGSDESDDDDEDEDEEVSSDEEADGNDEEAIFEAKLAEALGAHRADSEGPEGSDDDMDDDEMEQVDQQLAKVFQARRDALNQNKDKKNAKENMVNFKNRVLDLLEIYVKKCHSKLLALDLLLPLLRLTRKSTVKQISNKANSVLRDYTRLCKGTAIPKLEDEEPVWELLKSIHQEAHHSGPPSHASACSQASLLVVKVLVAHDKDTITGIVDVYGETRKQQFISKKCHIQPSFFTEWNNWCVSASKQMKN
ncbi:DNA-directed DNA polymerase [Aspergillus hancockii]|nr:DNA-directed DNA polymerase [Aspergillus hancockii]